MRRKLTQRGRDRREQLLAHAARLFAERGYHPTAVSDIVASLGVGKGVFYWYFSSKEELLGEILAEAQRRLRRRQADAIGTIDDPLLRLEAGIRATLSFFDEHRDFWRLVQVASHDRRFTAGLRAGQEVAVSDTARVIQDGMDAGVIPGGDASLAANAVLGVLNHVTRVYLQRDGGSVGDLADQVVAFCVGGVQAQPAVVSPAS